VQFIENQKFNQARRFHILRSIAKEASVPLLVPKVANASTSTVLETVQMK
jgi:hypothetical protein